MNYFTEKMEKLLQKDRNPRASYVEVLYQRLVSENIEVDNKALKSLDSESFSGSGVRVVDEGSMGYASTNDMTGKGFERTLERAVKGAKSNPTREDEPLRSIDVNVVDMGLPMKVNPLDVSREDKIELALDTNKSAWNDDSIRTTTTRIRLVVDERLFISTDGAKIRVVAPLVGLGHRSVAKAGGVKKAIWDSRSMCAGYEFIEHQDWNEFSAEVSDPAVETVTSKTALPSTYPVVVAQDVVGLGFLLAHG